MRSDIADSTQTEEELLKALQVAQATARKREEENLRRMATVVRDSNDAITIQDFEGKITAWNHGAELMYGYSEEEAFIKNIDLLTTPDKVEEQKDFIRCLIAGEAITSFETQRVTKDGRVLDVWMTVTKLMDDAGKPVGLASTERDITEHKRVVEEVHKLNVELEQRVAERTVQLEAANKELEAFAYSVSHDLRAPLRAVDGFSRILLEEYQSELSPDAQNYLNLVRSNTAQMGRLIDDLLTFSRTSRQALAKRDVDTSEIVRQVLEELHGELAGRKVEVIVGALLHCQADPAMLKQVFFNLISNAVKFTCKKEEAQIEIGSINNDGITTYFVKDNGVGFDMRYYGKLFGVFSRLHSESDYEGTGVGLALVQRIVHRHKGRVWAEAEVEKGATFYFTLVGDESG
jgi:PAS domain S-box-containing protein